MISSLKLFGPPDYPGVLMALPITAKRESSRFLFSLARPDLSEVRACSGRLRYNESDHGYPLLIDSSGADHHQHCLRDKKERQNHLADRHIMRGSAGNVFPDAQQRLRHRLRQSVDRGGLGLHADLVGLYHFRAVSPYPGTRLRHRQSDFPDRDRADYYLSCADHRRPDYRNHRSYALTPRRLCHGKI